jgi:hypothetical protein
VLRHQPVLVLSAAVLVMETSKDGGPVLDHDKLDVNRLAIEYDAVVDYEHE